MLPCSKQDKQTAYTKKKEKLTEHADDDYTVQGAFENFDLSPRMVDSLKSKF